MKTFVLFFQLGGDIDILSPSLEWRARPDVRLRLVVSTKLWETSARLHLLFDAFGLSPDFRLPPAASAADLSAALAGADALLTASETTLKPHALAHALANRANELGIATYTLQHGIENVGLTYFDASQGPEVRFASRTVCLWNEPSALPAAVSDETRRKCVCAGYARPLTRPFDGVAQKIAGRFGGRPVVGVFENLHWTRFSEAYRRRFLDDLEAACDALPAFLFLVKPHPEGRWLTERYRGRPPKRSNLLIADPADEEWRLLTTPSLTPFLSAVITTPSKSALDAAIDGVPTAVPAYDHPYTYYNGLPALGEAAAWISFAEAACASRERFAAANRSFAARIAASVGKPRLLEIVSAGAEAPCAT